MFPLRSLLLVLAGLAATLAAAAAEVKSFDPKDAAKLVAEGKAVLVDVREPSEWRDSGVAAPAVLLPMSDFEGGQKQWKGFLEKNREKLILLYCRSGGRSSAVADALAAKGFNVGNVGTLRAWTKAGLPVRQVDGQQP